MKPTAKIIMGREPFVALCFMTSLARESSDPQKVANTMAAKRVGFDSMQHAADVLGLLAPDLVSTDFSRVYTMTLNHDEIMAIRVFTARGIEDTPTDLTRKKMVGHGVEVTWMARVTEMLDAVCQALRDKERGR